MTGARPEAGETLVEILISVVVLGLAVSAIAGGLLVTTESSDLHRKQVVAQNALRAWAEQVSAGSYTECATAGSVVRPSPALPTGLSATVVAVRYWTGSAFATSCGAGDKGIQKVTLRIAAANDPYPLVTESVDVVVRKPCVSAC